MQCSSCGGEVSPTAKFCRSCGAKVDVPKQIPPSPTPPSNVSSGGEEGGESFYCGKCGTQNSTANDFCVNCGIKLHPAQVEVSTETAPSTSPPVKGKSGSNRTKYLAVFIIFVLIVAALFGSGLGQQLLSGTHLPLLSQATSATSTVTNLSGSTSQTTAETSTLASSLASSTSTVATFSRMPPSVFLSAPPAPKAVGCYSYSQAGWEKVPCVPHQGKNTEALPQSAPSQTVQFIGPGQGFFGIYSNQFGTTQPCWQANCNSPSSPILTYSILMVNIRQYGGEEDIETPGSPGSHGYDHSKPYYGGCGDGAYSIQLNTDWFPGKNGHTDWVQFMYNDDGADGNQQFEVNSGCDGGPELCLGNVNIDTNDYSQQNCERGIPDIRPSGTLEIILECYVSGGTLSLYGYLGGLLYSVQEPDVYGLEGQWTASSGGIMGYGGSSEAEWGPSPTNIQTDIAVSSCKNPTHGDLFLDCPAPAITATFNPQAPTGEDSSFAQYGPLFTSYYRGTHWWLSSASGCGGADLSLPDCRQFVKYGTAFGLGNVMTFTVEDHPAAGSVTAGGMASAWVNVTSVDGVVGGPITMSVGGLNPGGGGSLGTEDLTGHHCTPGTSPPPYTWTFVQPGSSCRLGLDVSTNLAAQAGTYKLTITGSPPPNVPESTPKYPVSIGSEDSTPYQLTIQAAAAPSVVIYWPTSGSSYPEYQPVPLIGYATQSIQGQFGGSFLSCSQLQFQAAGQKATPTQDPSTGYCDAEMTFTLTGSVQITLTATNNQGVQGKAEVTITLNPPKIISGTTQATPFTFKLSAPSASVITEGGSPDKITINIITTGGSPQPVKLDVSGLPNHAAYALSSKTVTPTAAVTLTITAPSGTAPGTYTVTITGTPSGGGTPQTVTIQLSVEAIG